MTKMLRTTDLTVGTNRIFDLADWLEDEELYGLRIRKNQLAEQKDRDNLNEIAANYGYTIREYKDYKNQECYEFKRTGDR
jgi:hypothetical protein